MVIFKISPTDVKINKAAPPQVSLFPERNSRWERDSILPFQHPEQRLWGSPMVPALPAFLHGWGAHGSPTARPPMLAVGAQRGAVGSPAWAGTAGCGDLEPCQTGSPAWGSVPSGAKTQPHCPSHGAGTSRSP